MERFSQVLGLERVSDRFYVLCKDGKYAEVDGTSISMEDMKEYEMFLTQLGDRYFVVERITGQVIAEGDTPQEAVSSAYRKLLRKGLMSFEKEIAMSVYRSGRLSPAYKIKEDRGNRFCVVCGKHSSLPPRGCLF